MTVGRAACPANGPMLFDWLPGRWSRVPSARCSGATKADAYGLDRWLCGDDGFGTILHPSGAARRHGGFVHWGLRGSGGEFPPGGNPALTGTQALTARAIRTVSIMIARITCRAMNSLAGRDITVSLVGP